MGISEEGKIVIQGTAKTKEFVKYHWQDSIGAQYVHWIEQTEEKLKQIDRQREILHIKCKKIALLCKSVSSDDEGTPKIKTMIKPRG